MMVYHYYEHLELPHSNEYTTFASGINISSTKLTGEIVDNCHRAGQRVGVWINREVARETEELYDMVLRLGVDTLCSDFPVLAREFRDKWYETTDLQSSST